MDAAIWFTEPHAGFYCTPFDRGQKKPVVKTGDEEQIPPDRLELSLSAPEADALSAELRGQQGLLRG